MLYLKYLGGVILLMLLWAVLATLSVYQGWFSRPLAAPGDTEGFFRAAKEYAAQRHPPVLGFALIKNGRVVGDYYSSSAGETVNADTLFPIASASKMFAAYGAMVLKDRGQLDLERAVPEYLHRWHLPPSEFDNNKVTARLLMSHRAGIHDHLGWGDYSADEPLPTLVESLTNPRASSGKPVKIGVTSEPGSGFDYSGGSYLVLELIIEEISGKSFEQFMGEEVFKPLGMTRSNYDFIGASENSVHSYTEAGERAPQYKYASSAATALNTSIHDLTQFARAQIPNSGVSGVVSQTSLASMRQPQTSYVGVGFWGMGAILSSKTDRGDYIYFHDGGNEPAINSSVKINPDNGDAMVALVNGNIGLASVLTAEWSYWQTGKPDWMVLIIKREKIVNAVLYGWGAIVVVAIVALVVKRKSTATASA